MNTDVESFLLNEIAPRLQASIPRTVPLVAPDDPEELLQDGLAIALHLHRSAEHVGKKVSPGNIAHYTILALRSGRRSTGIRKNDVLHPAAQLCGHARVQSLDEPIRDDDPGEEPLTLHDCLASAADDPATTAARRLDWAAVVESLDRTARAILTALVQGRELTLLVRPLKRSRSARHRRRKAAAKCHLRLDLQSFLPRFAIVDTARHADAKGAREVCAGIKAGEIVIFDKAYVDFDHLADLTLRLVFWVTRAKDNLSYPLTFKAGRAYARWVLHHGSSDDLRSHCRLHSLEGRLGHLPPL